MFGNIQPERSRPTIRPGMVRAAIPKDILWRTTNARREESLLAPRECCGINMCMCLTLTFSNAVSHLKNDPTAFAGLH